MSAPLACQYGLDCRVAAPSLGMFTIPVQSAKLFELVDGALSRWALQVARQRGLEGQFLTSVLGGLVRDFDHAASPASSVLPATAAIGIH